MEHYNRIIELLDKKSLTPEEKNQLDSYRKNEETAIFIAGYTAVKKALEKSHISADEMADYILYKNNQEPADNLISYRIPAIDAHLKECKLCSSQMNEFKNEYSNIGDFVSNNLYQDGKAESSLNENIVLRKNSFKPVYAFASIIVVGLVYLLLFAVSGITTPDYLQYASITKESEVYLTRGRASEEFLKSFDALENKNYNQAIGYLERDIENNKTDETIFYSYYILGLTYLEMSESKFLGLFPSYNENNVKQGLNNLQSSVELNTTGKFDNIKLDAFFYMAKGNLMLGKKETAKEYLQTVIARKGSKMEEAAVILDQME